ncbi:MAG: hypothetical protein ACYCTY_06870, partial [Sulfuricella sp.]
QRARYHDNDPSPMSKSVPERVLQTQHQEKTIEGRLGRQLPLQRIVCINVLMRLPWILLSRFCVSGR